MGVDPGELCSFQATVALASCLAQTHFLLLLYSGQISTTRWFLRPLPPSYPPALTQLHPLLKSPTSPSTLLPLTLGPRHQHMWALPV